MRVISTADRHYGDDGRCEDVTYDLAVKDCPALPDFITVETEEGERMDFIPRASFDSACADLKRERAMRAALEKTRTDLFERLSRARDILADLTMILRGFSAPEPETEPETETTDEDQADRTKAAPESPDEIWAADPETIEWRGDLPCRVGGPARKWHLVKTCDDKAGLRWRLEYDDEAGRKMVGRYRFLMNAQEAVRRLWRGLEPTA